MSFEHVKTRGGTVFKTIKAIKIIVTNDNDVKINEERNVLQTLAFNFHLIFRNCDG